MANEYFSCQAKECFGNCFGKCHILTEKITDKPCPFYKTRQEVKNDRVADLIDRWESRMSERK